MSLIIDGHNLIGVMPDIRLGDPDDELRLLQRLRAYRAASGGRTMIVFFDAGDLPARIPDLSSTGVLVRFSAPGQTADDAIVSYLEDRAQPGQYAVVTNDQELARRAREAGASVMRASEFAAKLAARESAPAAQPEKPTPDPRDPAFVDIYEGFIQAEKGRGRFARRPGSDIGAWIEKLYGDDLGAAQQAARWLGESGESKALEPLRDALTHGDVRVRAAALLALGDLGDRAALPELCNRLAHDPGSMAREAAAQSLARLGDRSVEAALETAARSDPKSKVRRAARNALEQIRARRGR